MKAYIFGLLIKLNAVSAWWASWGPRANEKGCEDVTQANINPKTTGGVGFNLGIRLQGCVVMMPRIVSPTMWQHKTITATTWTQLLITQGFAFVLRRARKHTHTSTWGLREIYGERGNTVCEFVACWGRGCHKRILSAAPFSGLPRPQPDTRLSPTCNPYHSQSLAFSFFSALI